jgi:predicted RNA-binding Zn-ribbon protein involved in translation (DUF1610 family)
MEIDGTPLADRRSNRGIMEHRHLKRLCPQCGDTVLRVPRRVVDRLYSLLFHPIHRYQCTSLECGWQGNLPQPSMIDDEGLAPLSTPTGSH